MRHMSWGNIYVRRPLSVSIAIGIAAVICFAGAIAGIGAIFSLVGPPTLFGNLVTYSADSQKVIVVQTPTDGWVMLIWNLFGLMSAYFAQLPKSLARFAVIGFTGVTSIYILSTITTKVTMLEIFLTLLWAIFMSTPVILLLLRPANEYYAR